MGFTAAHFQREDEEIWPELWPMFEVFFEVNSSWRCGPSGPLCFDKLVVFDVLRHKGITGEDRDDLMRWLSVAETAALGQLAKK
ncbi:hypothetical protein GUF71_21670 [Xanthomonas citri pv. citri]|nr:hypothetical protein [Xanthomonas citri pv. citri]